MLRCATYALFVSLFQGLGAAPTCSGGSCARPRPLSAAELREFLPGIKIPEGRQPLGFSWKITPLSGWGTFGQHMLTRLWEGGRYYPIVTSEQVHVNNKVMQPLARDIMLQQQHLPAHFIAMRKKLNSNQTRLPFPVLHAVVGSFYDDPQSLPVGLPAPRSSPLAPRPSPLAPRPLPLAPSHLPIALPLTRLATRHRPPRSGETSTSASASSSRPTSRWSASASPPSTTLSSRAPT